ncbi:hypothetical protein Scani_34410 [Streptomyces caniferus]|uniref:Uncharacterized protein n=1 Tax=Streptomyces caniferus TaxID=285557 RepID=A0A640S6R3_9ACTN|nr:ParB/RepB/Spo0J family partition protein [Streptomyces caniferus]GFE07173.1 hypothetical protein Scani_34410 [Streptomyces caniferus]
MAGAQNDGLSVAERRRKKEEERRRLEAEQAGAVGSPVVALSELAHNPRNARGKLEGIEGLADTYATSGVLQPLAVVPVAVFRTAFPECSDEIGEARYVVIGGNRRLSAARHAGLSELPVLVNTRAQTRKDILVAAATENLAREELKPLEELATIEELKAEFGTYDAVAAQLGKSAGWVSQRRRLHNLQPEVREALEARADGMTIELARALGKIKDRDLQLQAWEAERRLAADRAAEPKPKKGQKGGASQKPRAKVPAQGRPGAGEGGLDQESITRREACATAVAAAAGDLCWVQIIAMQSPALPDDAVALAARWLTDAGVDASALELPSLSDETVDVQTRHQTVLALALAHCELQMTDTVTGDSPHVRAYLDWMASFADYKPAETASTA